MENATSSGLFWMNFPSIQKGHATSLSLFVVSLYYGKWGYETLENDRALFFMSMSLIAFIVGVCMFSGFIPCKERIKETVKKKWVATYHYVLDARDSMQALQYSLFWWQYSIFMEYRIYQQQVHIYSLLLQFFHLCQL